METKLPERTIEETTEWIDWMPNHPDKVFSLHPDVLILAARYGDGHLRAAKAIALQLLIQNPKLRVGIIDYYRYVSPAFDNSIRWAYLSSVRFAPMVWRWFYSSTQRIEPTSSVQQLFNQIGMSKFYQAIRDNPPKVIISTYPTAAGVVSTLQKERKLDVVNLVVMTDYSVHSQWIHPGVEAYFVGSDDMRQELSDRGIAEQKIIASGIPIDERFREGVDEGAVRAQYGLGTDPVILFMGGSYMPAKEFERVLQYIDEAPTKHTTLVVAGKGEPRRQLAEEYQKRSKNPMQVFGFVNNVHELMAVSHLLVSKAGGLTTTESLCRGIPVIVYRPIPGQEDANAEFLARHGVGLRAKSEENVGEMVSYLLEHPWELKQMAVQAKQLGHPDASETIATMVNDWVFRRQAHAPA